MNWKYDLFTFKQNLTIDQLEISSVVEKHLHFFDRMSEVQLVNSLKENLNDYKYDNDVKGLLESFQKELESAPLVYNLKDLYKKVESKNYGSLYKEPISKILDIIVKPDDGSRMESIMNELAMYDWIPVIKNFVASLTSDPVKKQNYVNNNAKQDKVYAIAESIDGGHITFIGDRWFKINENGIEMCNLTDTITDKTTLNTLSILEKVMIISNIENDIINFRIDENLTIGVGMNKAIYMNGEVIDEESSIEDIFNSPMIPSNKRTYYNLIECVSKNVNRIVEMDIACKITALNKPTNELYAFNYKDKMHLYSVDKRSGSSLYEYDSVTQLIEDVQKDMGYDVTLFFENKLSKELKQFRQLEDREKQIELKISDVNESIDQLKENEELMKESIELKTAFDELMIYKHNLNKVLNDIRNEKVQGRKRI